MGGSSVGLLQLGKSVNVCDVCMKGAPLPGLLKQGSFWGALLRVPREASSQDFSWDGPCNFTSTLPVLNSFRCPGSRIRVGPGNALPVCSFSFNSSSRSAAQHGVRQELIQQTPHVAALPGEARA